MSDTTTSQPPPPTDGDTPWGSFYTTPTGTKAGAPAAVKSKPSRSSKRSKSAKAKEGRTRRARGSLTGGGRRQEDQRTGRLRLRGSRKEERRQSEEQAAPAEAPEAVEPAAIEPGLPPVAAPAGSRRFAEPHVLVGVVGGTIIALAALLIALLYMIGNAA